MNTQGQDERPEGQPFPASPCAVRRTVAAQVWLGVAIALAVGACAVPGPARPARPLADRTALATTPEHGTTTSAASKQDVVAAYRQFWYVAQHLDVQQETAWRATLARVATDPALTRILDELRGRVDAGYHQFGSVIPRPTAISVHGDRASVLDCQDASRTGELDDSTGLATNVGQARTPVAAVLVRGTDHRWRVSDANYLSGDC